MSAELRRQVSTHTFPRLRKVRRDAWTRPVQKLSPSSFSGARRGPGCGGATHEGCRPEQDTRTNERGRGCSAVLQHVCGKGPSRCKRCRIFHPSSRAHGWSCMPLVTPRGLDCRPHHLEGEEGYTHACWDEADTGI
jgi:hypothetical protein